MQNFYFNNNDLNSYKVNNRTKQMHNPFLYNNKDIACKRYVSMYFFGVPPYI
jgi:hypothetical protein